MKIKRIIKHNYNSIKSEIKYSKYYSGQTKNAIAANLIRKTHSIEKGLSLKNIRMGFGHEKQKEMIKMIQILSKEDNSYYEEVISMAVSAINAYLSFHKKNGYTDDYNKILEQFIVENSKYLKNDYGGVKKLNAKELEFNIREIEKFFNTRHSIRDFSDKEVEKETIIKAIKLAQTAPSACNRQGYRVHIFDKNNSDIIIDWLSGIGGFADSIDKFALITASLSSYNYYENYQYIVSASIFAAYLSLTLHLYGLGACIVQRPVIWTKKWDLIRKKFNISEEQQVICIIGIGNLKDYTNVPISHRISTDEIIKFY